MKTTTGFVHYSPAAMICAAAIAGLTAGSTGQEPGAADTDGDGLPDSWELLYFGNLSAKPGDDPDGDSLNNQLELEIGTNPRLADSDRDGHPDWMGIPGYLLQEKWAEPDDSSALAPSARQTLNRPGASQFFHPGAAVESVGDNFFRERLRGTLTAPMTGDYEFWIAGDNGCELWLGVDTSRFGARKLAGLPREDSRTLHKEWDKYPSQKSQPVKLLAGHHYYIEMLHRDFRGYDHVEIAWKPPGGTREPVPAGVLKSWVVDPEDQDDDGMRDQWEAAHSLVVGKQDAMEDPDGDGIVNVIEHDVGSDPQDAGAVPGMLDWSRWFGPQGRILPETVMPGICAREPDRRDAVHGLRLPPDVNRSAIDRFCGTLTAPEDGYYSFWIMGKRSATLSLSPDTHAFNKRVIVRATPNTSCGYAQEGRYSVRSLPVRLRKGGEYFIEAMLSPSVGSPPPMNICWAREQPLLWSETELGGVRKGTWTEQDGALTATVSGAAGFGGNQGDAVWFRNSAAKGVVEAICRMDLLSSLANGAGGGLMFRASNDPYAPFAAVTLDSHMKIGLHSRTEALGEVGTLYQGTSLSGTLRTQDSVWLRVRSDGKDCRAFFSLDGVTWHGAGQIKLAFGDGLNAGPVAWGGNSKEPSVLTFSDLVMGDPWSSEEVPDEVLATCRPDPLDVDRDSLPDAWERLHGLDPACAFGSDGEVGDPDCDGLGNAGEYRLGADPLKAGGVPGFLTLERWNTIPGSQVSDLLDSRKFRGEPDVSVLVSRPDLEGGIDNNYGQRLRGTLIAPATGIYRFWIAGDNGCSLSLSPDARKAGLREIASLAGAGGASTGLHEWDRFASQASAEIELTGGSEYLIEILHKEGRGADHVSVAWAYRTPDGNAQAREILPSRVLRSYVKDLTDLDQDGLPDEWEVLKGLSPEDNGFYDAIREGAGGDHDRDGLTNLDEYRLGTHPCVADTDGDGVNDGDEQRIYHTDPLTKDTVPPVLEKAVPLAQWSGTPGSWLVGADGTLASMERRGSASWDVEVASPGIYLIEIVAGARGATSYVPQVPVTLLIDNLETLRGHIVAGGQPTRLAGLTRWLAGGTHRVTLDNRNVRSGVGISIVSVNIYSHQGADLDTDGIPDWLENICGSSDQVGSDQSGSAVSPACVEGEARFADGVALTVGGVAVPAREGLRGKWFADIPLDPASPVELKAAFEGGAITQSATIRWIATNLMVCPDVLRVRAGDSLLLTAIPEGAASQTVAFEVKSGDEITCSGTADKPQQVRFAKAGHTVLSITSGTSQGTPLTRTVTVEVSAADFGTDFSLAVGYPRPWELPLVSRDIFIEADSWLTLGEQATTPPAPRAFLATAAEADPARVLARLWENGPVLAATTVNGFRFATATETGNYGVIRVLADGTRVIEVRYVIDGVIPKDLSIWLHLYVTDAIFANGDTWYELTAKDFDESGEARLLIYKAPGTGTPYVCHWIKPFYQEPPAGTTGSQTTDPSGQ